MKKIVFVILHYLTDKDTSECIASIRKCCKEEDYQIVVVDNASPNSSGTYLMNKYAPDNDVDVLILDENIGFAKGNNRGIDYAREKYDPQFMVTLNNDVLLLQKDTVKLIEQEYERSKFSVLGPMVYTADGRCNDNPGVNAVMTLSEANDTVNRLRRAYFLYKCRLGSVYWVLRKIINIITRKNERTFRQYIEKEYNVQLHGCFLCFSKEYFKVFEGFYPGTFLYMEEDILFYLTQREKLTTVYLPELKIFHKEDSSSNAAWKTNRARALNKMYYMIQSAKELRRILSADCG